MKQELSLLMVAFALLGLQSRSQAQETPAPIPVEAAFGPAVTYDDITDVQVRNLEGASLGRIADLALDLSNGRVVEVLVISGQNMFGFGGKTVAVPPRALLPDANNEVYTINMSAELFKAARAFDLAKWAESTQPEKVAAAYHYFGQVPTFLVANEATGRTSTGGRPLEALGIVERLTKLIGMPVVNLNGTRVGQLESLVLDVPRGRILNAYIQAPNNNGPDALRGATTVIPATMLSFTASRNGLVLDVSSVAYSKEPHVIFQFGTEKQPLSTHQQPATGAHTTTALAQGTNFRDITITHNIYSLIQDAKLDPSAKVEVGTLEGRVTLRGPVPSQSIKDRIGAIAIGLVRLENVDNQIEATPQR